VSPARPRLVASDLDGTLVRSDGTVSARTRRALALVEDSGATLVLVTGRPPRWMAPVAEQTGHRGLAVCANGALVYDLHAERVIEEHLIEPSVLRDVIAALRRELPDVRFAAEYGTGFVREASYGVPWHSDAPEIRVVDETGIAERPAAKLLARHPHLDADALLARSRDVVGELATLTHSSLDGLLEISAAGVTKATGLASLCERLGVEAGEVVAFGDMPNDLPMLAWAGTSYAVANAHADVLAAVARHTASNDEDGVACVLEELLGA